MVFWANAQQLYIGSLYVTTPTEESSYGDGRDLWQNRLPVICDMFNFEQPDVLGLQSLTDAQLSAITNGMTSYLSTGNILYNNTLQLLASGTVSGLPSTGSCNWAKLSKAGSDFYVFNIFFNTTSSSQARTLANQILQAIPQINTGNLPCFVVGNMGLNESSNAYSLLAAQYSDCFTEASVVSAEFGTKNNFDIDNNHGSQRYDFIFAPKNSDIYSYGQLQYGYYTKESGSTYKRRLPSTHYPVMAKVNLSDAAAAEELYVGTYNVRNQNSSDTNAGNGWETRRTYLINFVNAQRPDLLGVQEAVYSQVNDLLNGLKGYGYIGVGRTDGGTSGEYSAIFYRKERMAVINSGTFWLSETPNQPSNGFPQSGGSTTYKRICTWGKFYDKVAGSIVYHFNTHMDLDETNRIQSYYLIKNMVEEIAGTDAPVFISGDYNDNQFQDAYNLFDSDADLFDSYKVCKQRFITNGTSPGFDAGVYSTVSGELRRIDHIFVTGSFDVEHYGVLTPCYYSTSGTATYTQRLYSDHYPVMVKLSYNNILPSDFTTTPPPCVNGVYQLSNADDMKAFSNIVNGINYYHESDAKAVMTQDIDMAGVTDWTPIGSGTSPFTGIFDGRNHTVSNLSYMPTGQYNGLFGAISGATVKDFSINGDIETLDSGARNYIGAIGYTALASKISGIHSSLNVTVRCESQAGGVVGGAGTDSNNDKPTIENCSYSGTLTVSDGVTSDQFGGIIGYTAAATIKNCLFNGTAISNASGRGLGGIVGYTREYIGGIQNCLSVGTIEGSGGRYGHIIGNFNTTEDKTSIVKNNYYLSGTVAGCGRNATKVETIAKTAEEIASGEVCYLLNGSSVYEPNWYHTLGTDANPVLYDTHGIVNRISSEGYTTQYIPTTDVVIPAGVEAYAGVLNGDKVGLRRIGNAISKEDAVVLKGTASTYYSFIPTTGAAEAERNDLIGSDGVTVSSGDSFYALSNKNGIGFYSVSEGITIPAGKAYLNVPGSGGVKGFVFSFGDDDDPTSINEVNGQWPMINGQSIYNLAGQRLNKMQKGINIIGGKKLLVK